MSVLSSRPIRSLHILQSTYDTPNVFKKLVLPRKYTLIFHRNTVDLHIGSNYLDSADIGPSAAVITGKWESTPNGRYEIHIRGPDNYSKEVKNILNSVERVLPQYTNAKLVYNKRRSSSSVKTGTNKSNKSNKSKKSTIVTDDALTALAAMDRKNERRLTYGAPRLCKACRK